jgi:hypothetical protein
VRIKQNLEALYSAIIVLQSIGIGGLVESSRATQLYHSYCSLLLSKCAIVDHRELIQHLQTSCMNRSTYPSL